MAEDLRNDQAFVGGFPMEGFIRMFEEAWQPELLVLYSGLTSAAYQLLRFTSLSAAKREFACGSRTGQVVAGIVLLVYTAKV